MRHTLPPILLTMLFSACTASVSQEHGDEVADSVSSSHSSISSSASSPAASPSTVASSPAATETFATSSAQSVTVEAAAATPSSAATIETHTEDVADDADDDGSTTVRMRTETKVQVRNGETQSQATIMLTARPWSFAPDRITVSGGQEVTLEIVAQGDVEGFAIPALGVSIPLQAGETARVRIPTDRTGTFAFTCTGSCRAKYPDMKGTITIAE